VTANAIIPQPVPSAPLSDWTSTRTRQTVTLEREGVTLRGWRFRAPRAGAPTLLFFNGNGMTIGESEPLYRRIAEAGAEVVVFDYRGYGFSGGVADVAAFRQDALAEYDWLVQQAGGPVAVYGFSLGTVMATSVAAQRPVKGLILAGTIASAAEEMPIYARAHGLPEEQIQAMHLDAGSVEAFDEVGRIAKSQAPLLMLHGEGDRLVPIAEGREVFAASPARQKRFVALRRERWNRCGPWKSFWVGCGRKSQKLAYRKFRTGIDLSFFVISQRSGEICGCPRTATNPKEL
jgi:pimeloyl-ACP methyl ester carboxylesterase